MFGCRFLWVYLLRVSGVFFKFCELIFLAAFRKLISSLLPPSPSGTADINVI